MATGQVTGSSIQEKTQQCLVNIAVSLSAAGSSMDKVVSGKAPPPRAPGMRVSIAVIAEA